MKKLQFAKALLFLLVCFSKKTTAQYYFYDNNYYDNPIVFELGGSVGIMNCLTDLGGNKGIGKKFIKDLNFGNTQLAGSVYLSAIFKNAVALRVEGTFGQLKAYDSILKKKKLLLLAGTNVTLVLEVPLQNFLPLQKFIRCTFLKNMMKTMRCRGIRLI